MNATVKLTAEMFFSKAYTVERQKTAGQMLQKERRANMRVARIAPVMMPIARQIATSCAA